MLSLFPDLNVWVALAWAGHVHHTRARAWLQTVGDSPIYFCRLTQLGLLRLLTTTAVMGADVQTQAGAWVLHDRVLAADSRVRLLDEPSGLETALRALTQSGTASPKHWADAYLEAFAQASGLTIVTLDQAFATRGRAATIVLED